MNIVTGFIHVVCENVNHTPAVKVQAKLNGGENPDCPGC